MSKELTLEESDNMGNSIRQQILEMPHVGNATVKVSTLEHGDIFIQVWPTTDLKEQDFMKLMCKIQNQYEAQIYVTFRWPVKL